MLGKKSKCRIKNGKQGAGVESSKKEKTEVCVCACVSLSLSLDRRTDWSCSSTPFQNFFIESILVIEYWYLDYYLKDG